MNKPENMIDEQLKQMLQSGHYDFSEDFSHKTMLKIHQIDRLSAGSYDWSKEFRRLIIPAAAILVLLIGINFLMDKNLSKDSIIGTSDLVENQFRVFVLKQLGLFVYR